MVKNSFYSSTTISLGTNLVEERTLLINEALNEPLEAEIQINSTIPVTSIGSNDSMTMYKAFNLYAIPTLVVILPTVISFFTDNVLLLTAITGSFPGVGVQFLIPSILAIAARSYLKINLNEQPVPYKNASPFRHWIWPYLTLSWATFAVIVVSANLYYLH